MRVWPDRVSASELWMTWSIRVVLSRASIHPHSELPTESLVSASYPGTRKTRFIRVDCLALPRQWLSGGDGALDQRRLSIPVCVHPPGPEHGAADPSSTSYTHGSCTTVCGRDTPPSTHTDTPGGSHPSFVRSTLARTRIPAHPSWSPRGGWIRQTSCWILWMDAHWIWPARANTGEKTVQHFTRTSGISVCSIQRWFNVGPPSTTVARHRIGVGTACSPFTYITRLRHSLKSYYICQDCLEWQRYPELTHVGCHAEVTSVFISCMIDEPSKYLLLNMCHSVVLSYGGGEEASRWWSIRGWRYKLSHFV